MQDRQIYSLRVLGGSVLIKRDRQGRLCAFEPLLPLASDWLDRAGQAFVVIEQQATGLLTQPQRLQSLVSQQMLEIATESCCEVGLHGALYRRRRQPERFE